MTDAMKRVLPGNPGFFRRLSKIVTFRTNDGTALQDDRFLNIARYLRQMAEDRPFRRAVVAPAGRDRAGRVAYAHLTFRQLEQESDRIAFGLARAGIGHGTRTIVMVRPGLELFALAFALFKAGAVPVMVDPGMGIRRMMACFAETRPEALIGIPPAHVLRIVQPGFFSTVKTAVTVGRRWFWGGPTLQQLRSRPWTPFPLAQTTPDETAAILFTTGSTGPAKGVIYTHGIFDAQVRRIRAHFQIQDDEIDLPTFPLFALFDPALGMTAVIPDMDPTRPADVDPTKIIEAILDQGVTNMFASPALLKRVGGFAAAHEVKFPSLRRVVSAGAPVPPAEIEQFGTILTDSARIHTPYGATEAMPVLSIDSEEILAETRPLTEQGFGICVGRPLEGISVAVIRIDDAPINRWNERLVVQDGEIGEIAVRGDLVTAAYHERHVETALAKIADEDGFWHRMGDLGWRDKKGRIWFCGRKSHRVITADETLFTIPCEAIFNAHPGVSRSALVGIGPVGEQQPVICVELSPEGRRMPRKALRSELLDLAATHAHTQLVQTVLFHKAFPVDIRHNAKIFREKLAVWAAGRIGGHGRKPPDGPAVSTAEETVALPRETVTTPEQTVTTPEDRVTPPEDLVKTPQGGGNDPEEMLATKRYKMTLAEDSDNAEDHPGE
jgi:olefin beta-lactone synthetase